MGISQSLTKASSHPRFDKVQYSQSNSKFMLIHYQSIQNSLEFVPWQQKMELNYHIYNPLFHQNLLVIPKTNNHIVKNGFCSTNCNVLIQIQNKYQTTLLEQIKKRKQIGRYYSEEEIWFMANCIISLVSKIHQTNQSSIFGNMHPNNILIDSFGQVSCIGLYSLPKQKNHYEIFRQRQSFQKSYISPQLIGFAKKNKSQDYPSCIDKHRVQSYCVGLTLLSMATLTDVNGLLITDKQKMSETPSLLSHSSRRHQFHDLINLNLQFQLLQKVFNRYSNLLHKMICSLIQHNPQQRADLSLINKDILEPNRGYIQSMSQEWIKNNYLQQILQNQEQTQEKQIQNDKHQESFYHRLKFSPSSQMRNESYKSLHKSKGNLIDYNNLSLQNTIQIKKENNQSQYQQKKIGIQRTIKNSKNLFNVKFTYDNNEINSDSNNPKK